MTKHTTLTENLLGMFMASWFFMGWIPAMWLSGGRIWLFLIIWAVPCLYLMARDDVWQERGTDA